MHKCYVYAEIRKGIYGLKEAGILAYTALVHHLELFCYYPVRYTPGMWRQKTTNILFTLVVDDFGIKFYNKYHTEHILQTLHKKYEISVDWTGSHMYGLTIKWHYDKANVDISMTGYVQATLQRLQHPTPSKPQHAPHNYTALTYGSKIQYALPHSTLPLGFI